MQGLNYLLMLMTIFGIQPQYYAVPYKVRWMGTTKVHNVTSVTDKMVVNCYPGTAKTMSMLWSTALVHIFIKDNTFKLHVGNTPEDVYDNYEYWQSIITPDTRRTVSLDPFNQTCIYVETKEHYGIQVFIKEVDGLRVALMVAGIFTIFSGRTLSRNPLFFYLLATIFGVLAIILLILYYISRQSFVKSSFLATMFVGGWTTVVYFCRQIFNVEMVHNKYFALVAGFVSFLIAYRIGPPESPRTKNIMMWVIQGFGAVVILCSSWHDEGAGAVIVISLVITYLCHFFVRRRRKNAKNDTNGQLDIESNQAELKT